MNIKVISDKHEWDGWIRNHSVLNPFTQSWIWGDVLISEGKTVERLAIVNGEETVAQAQIVYSKILFGWQYAFCPKGPVIDTVKYAQAEAEIYKTIIAFLRKKNVVFFRCEPSSAIANIGMRAVRTVDINPPATLILNLNKPADQLRAGMHPKTRYNIALAQKKHVTVKQGKDFGIFWQLMNKTGRRDNFSLHHKTHYEKVLAAPEVFQLTAFINETPVACAVFIGFGNTFTYLYGASDYEYRNVMAPYLLQWEGMEMGNDYGSAWYDFFGVAPSLSEPSKSSEYNYDPKHQYAGVTRFKLGFGGEPHQDPGTFDVVVQKYRYAVYMLMRTVRRWM